MKSILLAAAAMIAVPAIAQDQTTPPATDQAAPAPADTMTPPSDPATTPADTTATPADSTMQAPSADPAMQSAPPATAPMGTTQTTGPAATPEQAAQQGGYQPAGPAVQGAPAPGAQVRFQPAADPNTAYPPPAAKESYPICKKGQYDGCLQASDARGKARRRR